MQTAKALRFVVVIPGLVLGQVILLEGSCGAQGSR